MSAQIAEIFDTDAAAAYIGLARNTLEKMRVFGTGPQYAKLGRAVRYQRLARPSAFKTAECKR